MLFGMAAAASRTRAVAELVAAVPMHAAVLDRFRTQMIGKNTKERDVLFLPRLAQHSPRLLFPPSLFLHYRLSRWFDLSQMHSGGLGSVISVGMLYSGAPTQRRHTTNGGINCHGVIS